MSSLDLGSHFSDEASFLAGNKEPQKTEEKDSYDCFLDFNIEEAASKDINEEEDPQEQQNEHKNNKE